MKNFLIGLLVLGSFSSFSHASTSESECMKEYKDISYKCSYESKSYPNKITKSAAHINMSKAKALAKELCEAESGIVCRYKWCSESYGLYSKSFSPGSSQTTTIGGDPDYSRQRRHDKKELRKLRKEAAINCSAE